MNKFDGVDGKATQKLNRSGSRDEGIIASTLRSRSRFIGSVKNPITGQIVLNEKECMKGEKGFQNRSNRLFWHAIIEYVRRQGKDHLIKQKMRSSNSNATM